MTIPAVLQSGSTSVLGHTYGVDDDDPLPIPAGSGCSRSSSESQQHDGVVVVVENYTDRSSPSGCRERWWLERKGEAARVSSGSPLAPPLILYRGRGMRLWLSIP